MNVSYENGYLKVDIYDLCTGLPKEDKLKLVESLACDDDLIRHVSDQIVEGMTENGYYGSSYCTPSPEPYLALDAARRKVAKGSSEVAKKEIEKLEKELKRVNENYDKQTLELIEIRNRLRDYLMYK